MTASVLAQIDVLRIFDDAYDRRVRYIFKTNAFSKHIRGAEVVLCHSLVHDDDFGSAGTIVIVKVAPGHERNFERLEIVARNPRGIARHSFALLRRIALD